MSQSGSIGISSFDENISAEVSEAFRINKANVYFLREKITQYNISINNINIEKKKSISSDDVYQNFQYFDIDKVDQNGNLMGETSYLFLTFDVTNEGNQPLTFTWNSMCVFAVDAEGYVLSEPTQTSWESRYRSGKDRKEFDKDYFLQTINQGETVSVTIGFLIDDAYVNSEFLYFAPTAGMSGELYNKWKVYQINTPSDSE